MTTTTDDGRERGRALDAGRLSTEMREQITEAYCDANAKCYDPADINAPIDQACESRKRASQMWLTVTGVGMLLDDLDRADAEITRLRALVAAGERYVKAETDLRAFLALDRMPVRERYGITEATTTDEALITASIIGSERNLLVRTRDERLSALLAAYQAARPDAGAVAEGGAAGEGQG